MSKPNIPGLSLKSIEFRLFSYEMSRDTGALKHGIRNLESGNGITETETETEYGICERRFQVIDLKEKNNTNDNTINKQIN